MTREPDLYNPDDVDAADAAEVKRKELAGDEYRAQIEIIKHAFIRVFKEGTPSPEDRRIVLENLEIFCRGERTPWHEDQRIHCLLTGRHEVYTRIHNYIRLPLDVLVVEALTERK